MRAPVLLLSVLISTTAGACRAPLPDPPLRPGSDAGDGGAAVAVEPDASLSAAEPVLRLSVQLPQGMQESASALALYEGELDTYHLRRIEKEDLPKTLIERRVASRAWAEADGGKLVLAPTAPLALGATYSLASPVLGLVAPVRIREAGALPLLGRVWPPPDASSGAAHAIYCADGGAPTAPRHVELSPGHVPARMAPGVGGHGIGRGACVHVSTSDLPDGGTLMPPPRAGDVALDPAPLGNVAAPAPEPPDCGTGEARFGPGCAEVQDDRLVVTTPDAPLFWAIATPGAATLRAAEAGGRFVVRGLQPATTQPLEVTTVDMAGREQHSNFQLSTFGARPHVVINEVLANPLGPEPTEEWVELVNDGSKAVELEGWVLSDIGGETILPSHRLEPHAFALIVREDFVRDDGLDPAPAADVALLRVGALGSHGLSNAGEPLELDDPSGRTVSRFPAVPKPKAGVSVARRHPWVLDDDPRSFGLSGGSGASPGAPNELQE